MILDHKKKEKVEFQTLATRVQTWKPCVACNRQPFHNYMDFDHLLSKSQADRLSLHALFFGDFR